MPISNDDPMYPGMTPDQIAKYQSQLELAAQNRAANQRNFENVNKDWLDMSGQMQAAPSDRGGNDPRFMKGLRTKTNRAWDGETARGQQPWADMSGETASAPSDRGGNDPRYMKGQQTRVNNAWGQSFDRMQQPWGDLAEEFAGAPSERGGNNPSFMKGLQTKTSNQWNNENAAWQQRLEEQGAFPQKSIGYRGAPPQPNVSYGDVLQGNSDRAGFLRNLAGDTDYAMNARMGNFSEPPLPKLQGPAEQLRLGYDPNTAAVQERMAGPTPGSFNPETAAEARNADFWARVRAEQGPMGGQVVQAFRPKAYPNDYMAAITMARGAAPEAAEAAATGGRLAGLARGAVGMMGGPALLGGLGVLNNAVDLSDENSVMRKAIHEGNYGTALARGAANFIPFAGTIWDNLAGNNHPNQPTVNKPQSQSGAVVMGPASNEDLVAAYDRAHAAQQPAAAPADPYNHGNYTSRAERVENFKLAHTYEDKPSVAAAKNQMQMLSRDLEAAKASGDRTRYAAASKRYNDFERMLAMGAASYPYNARAVSESPEYEWTGAGGY